MDAPPHLQSDPPRTSHGDPVSSSLSSQALPDRGSTSEGSRRRQATEPTLNRSPTAILNAPRFEHLVLMGHSTETYTSL
jgi:hypothetical protein